MNPIEERLERIEKKLDMLLARQQGAHTNHGPSTELEVDIDGPRGDPEVRFMPKRWTGPDHKGQPFSSCEPEFLDLLAEAYDWFAQRDDETQAVDKNGSPKSRWSRLDAARARAWAARLRARDGGAPAPRASSPQRAQRRAAPRAMESSRDEGFDSEIPF